MRLCCAPLRQYSLPPPLGDLGWRFERGSARGPSRRDRGAGRGAGAITGWGVVQVGCGWVGGTLLRLAPQLYRGREGDTVRTGSDVVFRLGNIHMSSAEGFYLYIQCVLVVKKRLFVVTKLFEN